MERKVCVPCKCGSQARERVCLCSPEIILAWAWDGPPAFSEEPINFPNYHGLWMGPHLLVKLIGLFGPALSPVSPNNLVPAEEGRVLISLAEYNAVVPWILKSCGFLVEQKAPAS